MVTIPPNQIVTRAISFFPTLISSPFIFTRVTLGRNLDSLCTVNTAPRDILTVIRLPCTAPTLRARALCRLLSNVCGKLLPAGAPLINNRAVRKPRLALNFTYGKMTSPNRVLQGKNVMTKGILVLARTLKANALFTTSVRGGTGNH